MKITKINVPTYRVNKKLLNHFELLKLQTRIANRKKKKGSVNVECITTGQTFKICPNGKVDFQTDAYKLMVSLAQDLQIAINEHKGYPKVSLPEIRLLQRGDRSFATANYKARTRLPSKVAEEQIENYLRREIKVLKQALLDKRMHRPIRTTPFFWVYHNYKDLYNEEESNYNRRDNSS